MWLLWEEGSHRAGMPRVKKVSTRALDVWVPELSGDPIRPRQRPVTTREQTWLDAQVKAWRQLGVIEPRPMQPLNNNLVFVAKSNGSIRTCVDCTPVNKVTVNYDWPLPRLQDVWRKHLGQRFYSRIDLKDAFFRIKVPTQYRQYTAFTSRGQQYQFRRMPFGLKTAPAIYQQFMDTCLAEFSEWATWYIDDILIGANTLAQLKVREAAVRRKLKSIGCQINEEKSESRKTALVFTGIYLFGRGVGPNLKQVRKLLEVPAPTTKKDMQSALGLVSYLRDFIPLVSHFTGQLYPGDKPSSLTPDEYEKQWKRLLQHVQSAANTLRHWKEDDVADLYTDASGHALGVIIIQNGKVVGLSSRKLTPAETRYSATDREHLALVHAAKRFKPMLHRVGPMTRVWSDHAALIGRKGADLTPRQARWQELVANWIPEARHVKGSTNPADIVSRWPVEIFGGAIKL